MSGPTPDTQVHLQLTVEAVTYTVHPEGGFDHDLVMDWDKPPRALAETHCSELVMGDGFTSCVELLEGLIRERKEERYHSLVAGLYQTIDEGVEGYFERRQVDHT